MSRESRQRLGPICDTHIRIVWETDWPFLSHLDVITYRQAVELFETWVPDPAMQQKILVDNPAKLFGF